MKCDNWQVCLTFGCNKNIDLWTSLKCIMNVPSWNVALCTPDKHFPCENLAILKKCEEVYNWAYDQWVLQSLNDF